MQRFLLNNQKDSIILNENFLTNIKCLESIYFCFAFYALQFTIANLKKIIKLNFNLQLLRFIRNRSLNLNQNNNVKEKNQYLKEFALRKAFKKFINFDFINLAMKKYINATLTLQIKSIK